MRRIQSLLSILIVLLFAVSCGEKTPPPPESLMGKKMLGAVQDLQRSYSAKDLEGVMDRVAPRFADRDGLVRTLKAVFAKYDTVSLAFQETKMLVEVPDRGDVRITLNWQGEWRTAGGDRLKDGARVTLLMDRATGQLAGIDGRSFFVPVQKQLPARQ